MGAEGRELVDHAFLATRLMIAGHTPEQAEAELPDIPDEFVVALFGVWEHLARTDQPHRRRLADAARRWARHRVG